MHDIKHISRAATFSAQPFFRFFCSYSSSDMLFKYNCLIIFPSTRFLVCVIFIALPTRSTFAATACLIVRSRGRWRLSKLIGCRFKKLAVSLKRTIKLTRPACDTALPKCDIPSYSSSYRPSFRGSIRGNTSKFFFIRTPTLTFRLIISTTA